MSELNKLEQYIISKKDKIRISSKDIKPGDIFLALKGKRFHGNKFISEAINKGARFCITAVSYTHLTLPTIYSV